MKRFILLVTIFSIALSSSAQVRFGAVVGMNFSSESRLKLDGIAIENDYHFKPGFHAGLLANIHLSNELELEPAIEYSEMGYDCFITQIDDMILDDVKCKVSSHYLSVPITLKCFVFKGAFLECGPQIGYLLSKKEHIDNYEPVNCDNVELFDFGYFGGIGYRFSNCISLSARYYESLTNNYKKYDGGRNRCFQLSLSYIF